MFCMLLFLYMIKNLMNLIIFKFLFYLYIMISTINIKVLTMKYTVKVELEVEIDLFETDYIDEEEQEELNDIITETLLDNGVEITQEIFNEMKKRTNVSIQDAFTFNEQTMD